MNEEHKRVFREIREKSLRDAGVDPASEASLLGAIQATGDFYRLKDIVITLYDVGTRESLESLEKLLSYPKEDIKICAFHAIVTIMGADGQDKYVEKLTDPKFRDKFGAMLAIRQYCDDRAIEAVTKRLKAILAKERKAVPYSPEGLTELLASLDYLNSQGGDVRTNAHMLIRGKQDRLEDKEKKWIESNLPNLLGHGDEDQGSLPKTNTGQQGADGKGHKHSWFAALWRR